MLKNAKKVYNKIKNVKIYKILFTFIKFMYKILQKYTNENFKALIKGFVFHFYVLFRKEINK